MNTLDLGNVSGAEYAGVGTLAVEGATFYGSTGTVMWTKSFSAPGPKMELGLYKNASGDCVVRATLFSADNIEVPAIESGGRLTLSLTHNVALQGGYCVALPVFAYFAGSDYFPVNGVLWLGEYGDATLVFDTAVTDGNAAEISITQVGSSYVSL